MPRTLDVYLRRHLVGQLIQDENGQLAYNYAESWLNHAGAIPLSHSLPLKKGRFNRNECRGFFAGVLPDESKREIIAKNLGISARNDFAMLEQIGGECAGAVTFIPAGEKLPERNYSYRPLTGGKLAEILRMLPRRPLMAERMAFVFRWLVRRTKLPCMSPTIIFPSRLAEHPARIL